MPGQNPSISYSGPMDTIPPLPDWALGETEQPEKNYFIFLGSPDDGDHFGEEWETVVWTARKDAKIGDVVYFYFTAPVSAIIACGTIIDGVWINDDINSDWEGCWMAEIGNVEIFPNDKFPIKILRQLFPEWAWLRYPRQNIKIPAEIVQPFLELMK